MAGSWNLILLGSARSRVQPEPADHHLRGNGAGELGTWTAAHASHWWEGGHYTWQTHSPGGSRDLRTPLNKKMLNVGQRALKHQGEASGAPAASAGTVE
jgi:hypothetical protein